MSTDLDREAGTIGPEVIPPGEVPMVRQERWEEIRRLRVEERVPVAELARRFELDRKTVRRCLRNTAWRPYQRPGRGATLLAPHAEYLGEHAPQVGYSAQILFQELRQRGYRGSYETVKLFVRPLRAARLAAERTLVPGTVVDDADIGWTWKKRGQKVYFVTVRRPHHLPLWSLARSYYPWEVLVDRSRSVAALRRRLKELAAKK